jgi:hypothetical membrane protein
MKRNFTFFSSVFIVACYLLFSLLAFLNLPTHYSPMDNWLSDLGSYQLNPKGAIFYNLGIILTGVILLFFFGSLVELKIAGDKKQNTLLLLTQLFGITGAFAMIMSAVFPITFGGIHSFLSALLYILLGTAFAFSVTALRYYSGYPRWLLVLGGLIAVEDMVWGLILNTYLMEWITVGLFLIYILLLGLVTRRKEIYELKND